MLEFGLFFFFFWNLEFELMEGLKVGPPNMFTSVNNFRKERVAVFKMTHLHKVMKNPLDQSF